MTVAWGEKVDRGRPGPRRTSDIVLRASIRVRNADPLFCPKRARQASVRSFICPPGEAAGRPTDERSRTSSGEQHVRRRGAASGQPNERGVPAAPARIRLPDSLIARCACVCSLTLSLSPFLALFALSLTLCLTLCLSHFPLALCPPPHHPPFHESTPNRSDSPTLSLPVMSAQSEIQALTADRASERPKLFANCIPSSSSKVPR